MHTRSAHRKCAACMVDANAGIVYFRTNNSDGAVVSDNKIMSVIVGKTTIDK